MYNDVKYKPFLTDKGHMENKANVATPNIAKRAYATCFLSLIMILKV